MSTWLSILAEHALDTQAARVLAQDVEQPDEEAPCQVQRSRMQPLDSHGTAAEP
jgi:hypothetical protein